MGESWVPSKLIELNNPCVVYSWNPLHRYKESWKNDDQGRGSVIISHSLTTGLAMYPSRRKEKEKESWKKIAFQIIFLLLGSLSAGLLQAAPRFVKPGCEETCSNITISFSSGMGKECFMDEYEIVCQNHTFPKLTKIGDAQHNATRWWWAD